MSANLYLSDTGFVNTQREASALSNPESIEAVEVWLSDNAIPSKKPHKSTSYALKSILENELHMYITNGAFIQACINSDIRVERIDGGANAYIYAELIGTNPIKKTCKTLGLNYRELGERIGYGEEAISKAARSEEISRPMAAALDLLIENTKLREESRALDDLKNIITKVLSRK